MIGPLALLAASVAPEPPPAPAAGEGVVAYQPSNRVTARASVSVKIVSGVRFGSNQAGKVQGAVRRKAQLSDASGQAFPAELLEFQ